MIYLIFKKKSQDFLILKIMKSIKILVLLAAVTLSLCRENTSNNIFKKSEGSGNWNSGFDCPRINIAQGSESPKSQGQAKIYAKNIVDPQDENDKLGLVFEFRSAPGALFQKVATKISDNKYYIPYRYMNGDSTFKNPVGKNKFIEGLFVSDEKQTYRLKIDLPFKKIGSFINDQEGNKIAQAINLNANLQKGIVKNLKSELHNHSNLYIEQQALIKASKESSDGISKELSKQETELKNAKEQVKTLQTEIDVSRKVYNSEKMKLQALERKLNDLETKQSLLGRKINAIEQSKIILENNKKPKQKLIEDLAKESEKSSKIVDYNFKLLRKAAPNKHSEIEKSEKAFEDKNAQEFQSNLSKIYP